MTKKSSNNVDEKFRHFVIFGDEMQLVSNLGVDVAGGEDHTLYGRPGYNNQPLGTPAAFRVISSDVGVHPSVPITHRLSSSYTFGDD